MIRKPTVTIRIKLTYYPTSHFFYFSRRETMHAFLNLLREKYGGAETYVQKYCGMSAEDVETIRRNLVVLSQDQVRD